MDSQIQPMVRGVMLRLINDPFNQSAVETLRLVQEGVSAKSIIENNYPEMAWRISIENHNGNSRFILFLFYIDKKKFIYPVLIEKILFCLE